MLSLTLVTSGSDEWTVDLPSPYSNVYYLLFVISFVWYIVQSYTIHDISFFFLLQLGPFTLTIPRYPSKGFFYRPSAHWIHFSISVRFRDPVLLQNFIFLDDPPNTPTLVHSFPLPDLVHESLHDLPPPLLLPPPLHPDV